MSGKVLEIFWSLTETVEDRCAAVGRLLAILQEEEKNLSKSVVEWGGVRVCAERVGASAHGCSGVVHVSHVCICVCVRVYRGRRQC
jgi:hypothetical protein